MQLGAVPDRAAPARRAALPAGAGTRARRASTSWTPSPIPASHGWSKSSSPRSSRARPATAGRTRSIAAPTASTSTRSARPTATAQAASSCSTTTTFDQRRLGEGPRPAVSGLRLLVAPRPRRHDHQRVGHAEHGRKRREPRAAAGRQVRPPAARLGPEVAPPPAGAGPRRRAADGARAAAVARPEQDLRLRRRRRLAQGPLGVDLRLVPRERQVGRAQGDRDPRRAGRPGPAAAGAQAVRRRPAAGHGHQPEPGRQVPVRVLLGHRRLPPVRRQRPVQPEADRDACAWAASSRELRTRRSPASL